MSMGVWLAQILIVVMADDAPLAKKAIPDEAAQKKAVALVADIHKSDNDKAKTPALRIELAKKLLAEGKATSDEPAARYVLFATGRDLAAQQGDAVTALEGIKLIAAEFNVDERQLQVDSLARVASTLKLPKDHQACAKFITPFIDESLAADKIVYAKAFASLALKCARDGHDDAQLRKFTEKLKEIDETAAAFEAVKQANVTLEASPVDPAANLVVGRYFCFVKGDWRRGIPMLAISNDDTLRVPAKLELEKSPDELRLGDAWWQASDKLEGRAKTIAQIHASEWYRIALPNLSGLTRARVEKALLQISAGTPVSPLRNLLIGNRWARTINGHGVGWEFVFRPDGSCIGRNAGNGGVSGFKTWSLVGDELDVGGIRLQFKDDAFRGKSANQDWTLTIVGPAKK